MCDNGEHSHRSISQFEAYISRMDSAVADKLRQVTAAIPELPPQKNPVILSVGAGSGKLESALAAIYGCPVLAMDSSLQMIEVIQSEARGVIDYHQDRTILAPLRADAVSIPVADESISVVVASSVIHEIASVKDGYKYNGTVDRFFAESARVLVAGGPLVLRDFMIPENAAQPVRLAVGRQLYPDDPDPVDFLSRFATLYQGDDIPALREYLSAYGRCPDAGEYLTMPLSEALEIIVHYSWAKRLEDEARERYFFSSVPELLSRLSRIFAGAGFITLPIYTSLELQTGYVDHTQGRLSITDLTGHSLGLPPFTGVVAVRKQPA